jgi:hypothetical protein
MPSNLYQIGVWLCVGFFRGAGWAIAACFVGRILPYLNANGNDGVQVTPTRPHQSRP